MNSYRKIEFLPTGAVHVVVHFASGYHTGHYFYADSEIAKKYWQNTVFTGTGRVDSI